MGESLSCPGHCSLRDLSQQHCPVGLESKPVRQQKKYVFTSHHITHPHRELLRKKKSGSFVPGVPCSFVVIVSLRSDELREPVSVVGRRPTAVARSLYFFSVFRKGGDKVRAVMPSIKPRRSSADTTVRVLLQAH